MKLENSTSSPDTQMAKENAVNQVVTSSKSSLNQLGSWITKNSAKLSLVGILTFTNPNGISAQTPDVAKNTIPAVNNAYTKTTIDTAKNIVLKVGEDPIKDSVELKREQEKVGKNWIEFKKKFDYNNNVIDQLEMLEGPINFYNRIQEKQGGVVTEKDGKYARAGIAIIEKTQWLPEVKDLVSGIRRILEYILSQAPQQVITQVTNKN